MTFQELLKDEREAGRVEERREIVKNMFQKNLCIEEIADCTGLTEEQIKNLLEIN